jgi:peroxiredoxin
MEILLLIARLILAGVFGVAGFAKLFDLDGSEKAVADFGVPETLAKPLGKILPFAEIAVAVLLLPVESAWFGAIGAGALLFGFVGGIVYNMIQGRAPDCHCFGQIHSEPVGWSTLLRNLFLAAVALFVVLAGRENAGLSVFDATNQSSVIETMNLILGLATVGLLVFIAVTLRKILQQQIVLQRQIEILELTTGEGGGKRAVEREEATLPAAGLPVGAVAPVLALPDANGKLRTFDNLLKPKKPVLLFFVGANCAPCAALLPEIETWQREIGEKINFVFLSAGKAAENKEKFGAEATILLQKSNEAMELYQAKWTPTAVLINPDGTIGSRLATGDAAIRELVGKIKTYLADTASLNGHAPKNIFIARNGSKVGEDAPEFSLSDLEGKTIGLKDLRGDKTVVLFWGANCGYCQQILPDIRAWEQQPRERRIAEMVVITRGDAETNRGQNFRSQVLLEENGEVMEKFGADGTPSALIIDETGKIASELAVGSNEVFALLGYQPQKK